MSPLLWRSPRSYVVVDLGYGDAGKGITVARLCNINHVNLVVRFNGGCQAAHNVVTDDNRAFTFNQFGSGTFSGVHTYLSSFMVFEPFALLREAEALKEVGIENPLDMITVAWNALFTTPYHMEVNALRERRRGIDRHGSCGWGIGATMEYSIEYPDLALAAIDLTDSISLQHKLNHLRQWAIDQGVHELDLEDPYELTQKYEVAARNINIVSSDLRDLIKHGGIVFEGAQGVLLDQHVGFHPHTTWSTTTDHNVFTLLNEVAPEREGIHDVKVLGVTRTYMTRHGAGPFVTEDNTLKLPEQNNEWNEFQGDWRVGHIDLAALRYAARACTQLDGLIVTHVDKVNTPGLGMVRSYRDAEGKTFVLQHLPQDDFAGREKQTEALKTVKGTMSTPKPDAWTQTLAQELNVPLIGEGFGPKIGQGWIRGHREL